MSFSTVERQRRQDRKLGTGLLVPALVCVAVGFLPRALGAQDTGSVTGQVVNGSTGQPLSGAQVVIVGLDMGAITESNGRF